MAKAIKKDKSLKSYGGTVLQPTEPYRWRNTILLALISLYVLILFAPGVNYEFTNWDDPDYIISNPLIRDFSFEGIKNIMTTPVLGMYNPVPFLVYAFTYHFWELDPKPYHWVNIIFHILATIVLFKFIFQLTKRYEVASLVAILFAIHPLHASVVLWVSQTKTSLFLIFYFFGLTNYLLYIQNKYTIRYLVYALLLFLLAVLSKPSAVTFAPMLFLLDYYLSRKMDKRLFLEKIPFFLVAVGFGLLTLLTHSDEGDSIFEVGKNYSLLNNLLVSNYAVVFYLEKLFYPINLSTIYGYPDDAPIMPLKYYLALPVIPLIFWLVYKSGKFRKELVFGLGFFVIAISVLLRIVPSGFFGMANRYTYLSYTGLFFIMGQFLVYVLDNKFSYANRIKNIVLVVLVVFLGICTWRTTIRVKVWENSLTLFNDVIAKQPDLAMAYNQRAAARNQIGDNQGALEDFARAIELDSNYAAAYNNRGAIRDLLKDYDGALDDYNIAISLSPLYADAYGNRGTVKVRLERYEEALADFNTAIGMNNNKGMTYYNRAISKIYLGDTLSALKDWRKAKALGVEQSTQYLIYYGSNIGRQND